MAVRADSVLVYESYYDVCGNTFLFGKRFSLKQLLLLHL